MHQIVTLYSVNNAACMHHCTTLLTRCATDFLLQNFPLSMLFIAFLSENSQRSIFHFTLLHSTRHFPLRSACCFHHAHTHKQHQKVSTTTRLSSDVVWRKRKPEAGIGESTQKRECEKKEYVATGGKTSLGKGVRAFGASRKGNGSIASHFPRPAVNFCTLCESTDWCWQNRGENWVHAANIIQYIAFTFELCSLKWLAKSCSSIVGCFISPSGWSNP